jgi:hypothetical protein
LALLARPLYLPPCCGRCLNRLRYLLEHRQELGGGHHFDVGHLQVGNTQAGRGFRLVWA